MRGEPCCDRILAKGHRSGPSGFVICDGAGGNAAVAAAAALGARAGWRALLAVHRQLWRTPRRAPPALMVLRERFRRAFFHARPQAAPLMNHTVLACLWDRHHLVVAQVGDSTLLLLRHGGEWSLPLPPAKGDFANETTFLRPDTPTEAIGLWWAPAMDIEAVIGFSDGLEAAFLAPQPGTPHVLVPNRPLAELVIGEHRRRHGSRGYPTWLASSLADPALRELSDDDLTLVIAA
ncbi:protein phosphatase 2C domain-containing protein [Synechococcus sp. CBW1107]|uniref:protein phosphatase 2C domain-containing protein n=1 Tax=Synechococcus sp. CBW1107 TaxID=2789857 RepID=UPI002AD56BE6|nr:protein phosphatase 2C domain-containing protein [Synechococcus sp. CBW1107]